MRLKYDFPEVWGDTEVRVTLRALAQLVGNFFPRPDEAAMVPEETFKYPLPEEIKSLAQTKDTNAAKKTTREKRRDYLDGTNRFNTMFRASRFEQKITDRLNRPLPDRGR